MLAEHPIHAAALPEQRHSRPVAVRRADGKVRRRTRPRASIADWKPAARRADPIDLLIANSQDRMESLVPIRYGRMVSSRFAFYRGAAAIMAYDQAHREDTGIPIVISGDAHVGNINTGDVNVNGSYGWGGWYDYPVGAGLAFGTAAAVTAGVFGSMYYSLPPSCAPYPYRGYPYYSCGGAYYAPQYQGDTVVYVSVPDPASGATTTVVTPP